jgi:hypothetical protein
MGVVELIRTGPRAGRRALDAWLWCARGAWCLLPVTLGPALDHLVSSWSTGPARAGAVLAWLAWAGGAFVLFAPRPWGFSALRVLVPLAIASAIAAVVDDAGVAEWVGLAAALVAARLVLGAPVALACARGAAYGSEQRFPLRAPLPLRAGPLPLAALAVAAGIVLPLLALADANWLLGAIGVVVGLPIAYALGRALLRLDQRWLVLAPAGVVVVDPMTLSDPVLLAREVVTEVRLAQPGDEQRALDLRMGSLVASVRIATGADVTFGRRAGRDRVETVDADAVLVTPLQIRTTLPALRAHLAHDH